MRPTIVFIVPDVTIGNSVSVATVVVLVIIVFAVIVRDFYSQTTSYFLLLMLQFCRIAAMMKQLRGIPARR
jgi:hypothetical protein